MSPTNSLFIQNLHLGQTEPVKYTYPENGLRFERKFSREGESPFDSVEYERRTSVIREPDGTVVFEMKDIEIPKSWSQVATDIIAQKYFRKAGVPQYEADGTPKKNADGSPMLGPEWSAKQTMHRLAGTWRYWGEKHGYFASEKDAQIFYDELVVMLLRQMAAPNSPQWFNTGLQYAYGINGPAQGHYYVDPDTGVLTKSKDAYSHPQPHACGRFDTKLTTDAGILNLGDVVQQNRVGIRVFDGEQFVKILAAKNNGVRKLYRAMLKNGNYIEFTDDHQIWSSEKRQKDGGKYAWRALSNILGYKVEQVAQTEHARTLTLPAYAMAGLANTSSALSGWPTTLTGAFPVQTTMSIRHPSALELTRAELAGFAVGDGYYGKYNRNNKTTLFGVITINDDEFAAVTAWMHELFGAYTVSVRKNISDTYRIVMHNSKNVDAFVAEYELNHRAATAKVPETIMQGSREEQCAFLRSLFQADGCVRIRTEDGRGSGDIALTSISEELVHGVQILLLGLGIYSNVSLCNDSRSDRHTAYQLTIAYESERQKFERDIGFISEEKQEKLRRLNEVIDGKQKAAVSEETVLSIEYIGEETVYDIQTESGKFCANGVVVHNCFIQSINDDLVNDGGIMDLWVREARLFKYGSGTGTNFSQLRGRGEPLSGGGKSSGLMSWLKIGDAAAGAIKSGGTTRRAAKMVVLNMDHPDIEQFINWKVREEKKVAALISGGYPSDYEGEAYATVSGQNSNNSVRIPNKFMEAVEHNGSWNLSWRTDGTVCKTMKARELWNQIAFAAWACADPGVQYDDNVNEWHTCPESGRINASNPCSEYMFLDNTSCNLASLNLAHFFNPETRTFLVDEYKQAVRIWTVVLEISVLMAQYPSREIAQMSFDYRTLGLGYANIGSILMMGGIPYESEEAYAFTASVTAIMTAESYRTSAEMAKLLGPFPKFAKNKEGMLRVMRNHRRAAFNADENEYEKLTVIPQGINPAYAPAYLLAAAREGWNDAVSMGEQYGYRNAQTTLLAPTGTIGLLMDCATTGVEPDFALVKFKKLAGGGYFKIVNESVPAALKNLGYTDEETIAIINYMKGHGTLEEAPHINRASLKAKGFTDADVTKMNDAVKSAFEIQFSFNVWTLGEECMKRLGITPTEYQNPDFNMLKALGFGDKEIGEANEYVCGTMTIEGAPHLKEEHYPIFDCANKCGKKGRRFIHWQGHIRQMAAAQPFLSGAISKTINMPNEVTVENVKQAYWDSWKYCLKAVALYRDGCKLSQPLSTKSKNTLAEEKAAEEKEEVKTDNRQRLPAGVAGTTDNSQPVSVVRNPSTVDRSPSSVDQIHVPDSHALESYTRDGDVQEKRIYLHGEKRRLPAKRSGITISARIGNQKIWLRTGEYPDGKLAEIFIDMYKEGAGFRSLLNTFAISVSMALQYGVPLEKLVEKFTFTRFEPSGMTDHPNVKICTSVIDWVFRVLGMEYLGRIDFVQVPPKGIQKNKFEQLAKMLTESAVQEALDLTSDVGLQTSEKATAQATLPTLQTEPTDTMDAALSTMMGDAPACPTCGHITVRNGSCYKCLNCGDSLGCS
ncbi:MAG: adenosylcobalamin-dependent ribonucleoside-diphosphate reductase [Patescibacteria group bacterium]